MTGVWSAPLVERWRHVPTAVVADVSKAQCLIDPAIRPLRPAGLQPKLFGFAVTAVPAPPDFGAVLRALDRVRAGDVLVIAAGGHVAHAMIGGILGGFLHRKGAAGIVCDGAVRDVVELAAMAGFSVYARHVTPLGPVGVAGDGVNQPVTVGGRTVTSGDLVIGDDDGLVCLAPDEAEALIGKAEAKLALEDQWQARLKAGEAANRVFNL